MLHYKNPVHDPRCNSARETPRKSRYPRRNQNLSFATKNKKADAPAGSKQTNKSHARFLIQVFIIRRVCHNSMTLVISISYPPPGPQNPTCQVPVIVPTFPDPLESYNWPFSHFSLSLSLFSMDQRVFFVFGCEILSQCKRQIRAMTLSKVFSFGTFFFLNCQKSKGFGLNSPAIFRKPAHASHQAVVGFFNIFLSSLSCCHLMLNPSCNASQWSNMRKRKKSSLVM